VADALVQNRTCKAHSARTGAPCKKYAIRGSTVCDTHGGSAPQVKAKAEQRLREMVDPMISRLRELAMQTDNPKVAAECVRDALDRAGIGALVQAKVKSADKDRSNSGITVNIGILSNNPHTAISPQTIDVAVLAEPDDAE
jgi:hypothetical protein